MVLRCVTDHVSISAGTVKPCPLSWNNASTSARYTQTAYQDRVFGPIDLRSGLGALNSIQFSPQNTQVKPQWEWFSQF